MYAMYAMYAIERLSKTRPNKKNKRVKSACGFVKKNEVRKVFHYCHGKTKYKVQKEERKKKRVVINPQHSFKSLFEKKHSPSSR